jgi:subtilisin family serine protease
MVFFDAKFESVYTLDNPEAYLSERAIERRIKYNIPVTLQDLPVNNLYLSGINSLDSVNIFYQTKWLNGVLVEAPESKVTEIEQLSYVRDVQFVAPGQRLSVESVNESSTTEYLNETSEVTELTNAAQNDMIGAGEMHAAGFSGQGKMIAVFDAGFIGTNFSPYFTRMYDNNQVIAVWNFVENSNNIYSYDDHGTSVLSTITAYLDEVYVGVAPDADVILCVTEDVPTEYIIEEYNWLFAAEYADSIGVDIINTSLGYNTFDDPSMDYSYQDMDGNTAVITRANDIASSKGILCVVSVGNEGDDELWRKMVAPADADSVLAVGAVNEDLQYQSFSSSGPTYDERIKPEVSALGKGTSIVGWNGSLTYGSGTSYAAPLVAGLAAGVWQAYPDLNNIEIIELIKKGSTQYNNPDTLIGYGIPDFKAIQSEITSLDDDLSEKGYKIYPNPVEDHRLFVELVGTGSISHDIDIQIFDVNGSMVFSHRAKKIKSGSRFELDLKNLTSGIYILHLYSGKDSGKVKILVP